MMLSLNVEVVGDSVVVVVVVVVVAAVVVDVGWEVVVVEVVVLRTGTDAGRRCEADALNDLKIVWKFKSDGCDDVDEGAIDAGLCVDDSGDGDA